MPRLARGIAVEVLETLRKSPRESEKVPPSNAPTSTATSGQYGKRARLSVEQSANVWKKYQGPAMTSRREGPATLYARARLGGEARERGARRPLPRTPTGSTSPNTTLSQVLIDGGEPVEVLLEAVRD